MVSFVARWHFVMQLTHAWISLQGSFSSVWAMMSRQMTWFSCTSKLLFSRISYSTTYPLFFPILFCDPDTLRIRRLWMIRAWYHNVRRHRVWRAILLILSALDINRRHAIFCVSYSLHYLWQRGYIRGLDWSNVSVGTTVSTPRIFHKE
jgi:hypothetical protein